MTRKQDVGVGPGPVGGLTGSRRRCQVMIRSHSCLKSRCFVVVTVTLGDAAGVVCGPLALCIFPRTSLSRPMVPTRSFNGARVSERGKDRRNRYFEFQIARLHSRVLITIHAL